MRNALLVSILAACQTSPDRGSCDAMIACQSAVNPDSTAALLQGYGEHGSCWLDDRSAIACRQACDRSLLTLRMAHPSEAACDGRASDPSATTDPAADTSGNYPAGPYGAARGSTIENLEIVAKIDPDGALGTAGYASLMARTIRLSDYYNDHSVQWVVLTASAGWNNLSRQYAKTVAKAAQSWESRGARFVDVLVEGYLGPERATLTDVDRWQVQTGEHVAIGLDQKDELFEQFRVEGFPLTMIIRTSDMTILYVAIGVDPAIPNIEPILDQYAK